MDKITSLALATAKAASDFELADAARKAAKQALSEAYSAWRDENTGPDDRVVRGTSDWDLMIAGTKPQYDALTAAEREARNARRRLSTAVRRYREGA